MSYLRAYGFLREWLTIVQVNFLRAAVLNVALLNDSVDEGGDLPKTEAATRPAEKSVSSSDRCDGDSAGKSPVIVDAPAPGGSSFPLDDIPAPSAAQDAPTSSDEEEWSEAQEYISGESYGTKNVSTEKTEEECGACSPDRGDFKQEVKLEKLQSDHHEDNITRKVYSSSCGPVGTSSENLIAEDATLGDENTAMGKFDIAGAENGNTEKSVIRNDTIIETCVEKFSSEGPSPSSDSGARTDVDDSPGADKKWTRDQDVSDEVTVTVC